MGNLYFEIPPPARWQDFEALTLDICKRQWEDDYAQPHGRGGQAQDGVDIFGYSKRQQEHIGVQCKKRSAVLGDVDLPSREITSTDVDKETKAATGFKPLLKTFIIATTAPRDTAIQEHVRIVNATQGKVPFRLALWFWEDYIDFLNKDPTLLYHYYEAVIRARDNYSPQEHYLRMLAMAFDRPALRTELHMENRATDLIQALADTQAAIATGMLKDRGGRLIEQVKRPRTTWPELEKASRMLEDARKLLTIALKSGAVIEHATVVEVKDPALAKRVNDMRSTAVDLLNALLAKHKIDVVVWRS